MIPLLMLTLGELTKYVGISSVICVIVCEKSNFLKGNVKYSFKSLLHNKVTFSNFKFECLKSYVGYLKTISGILHSLI